MAAGSSIKHVVLTGQPGVGKSTLVHKVCDILTKDGIYLQGFYTEEIRAQGKRVGFDVVTLDGQRGPLARISQDERQRLDYRVGQYSVKLNEFEHLALPTLRKSSGINPIYVVDEVGKMELFSKSFIQSVRSILTEKNSTCLLTIPAPKGRQILFVEEIRNHSLCQVFMVTRENRNGLVSEIVNALVSSHR